MKEVYLKKETYIAGKVRMGLMLTAVICLVTGCSVVKKIDKREKLNSSVIKEQQIPEIYFEKKSISEVRQEAVEEMRNLGTKESKFTNCNETEDVAVVTEKDEIYRLSLEKQEGNDLSNHNSIYSLIGNQTGFKQNKYYRGDGKYQDTILNIDGSPTIHEVITNVETYMKHTYPDSPFVWMVEGINVMSKDGKDYVDMNVRPSYDGVPFVGKLVVNNGKITNTAKDFRSGVIGVTQAQEIYSYEGISPYYKVERLGEPITEVMTLGSALSVVSHKMGSSPFWIEEVELSYRLEKNMEAVPIWNILLNSAKGELNYQIDAVTGEVYYE